jgi:hypothetical protein
MGMIDVVGQKQDGKRRKESAPTPGTAVINSSRISGCRIELDQIRITAGFRATAATSGYVDPDACSYTVYSSTAMTGYYCRDICDMSMSMSV